VKDTRRLRILFVPGKNPKPPPEIHRDRLWQALVRGVDAVDPEAARQLARDPSCFVLCAWNEAYYGSRVSPDRDAPAIERLLQHTLADARDRKQARSWTKWAVKIMYALGDRFNWLIRYIPDPRVKSMIADTAAYFENRESIASRVREFVKTPLRSALRAGERVLLIGHSMGSVIGYESMWELTYREHEQGSVDLFLTLGSPLGMYYVQQHLLGMRDAPPRYPGLLRKWKNVSAHGDLVSVDATVSDDFRAMVANGEIDHIEDFCDGVYNAYRGEDGLNVHKSYGYLVNPVVGQIIADWWRDVERDHRELFPVRSGLCRIPVLVAHRGCPRQWPENTLPGFEHAFKSGARAVELDIQLTADHVPVLYHDATLDRVSGVTGRVTDLSVSQLKNTSAAYPSRFGSRHDSVQISTLAEFVRLLRDWPQAVVFVELKEESIARFGARVVVDRVWDLIAPLQRQCVLISFDAEAITYARTTHGARIGWVIPESAQQISRIAHATDPDFVFCDRRILGRSRREIGPGRWQWVVYVVDDPESALDLGRSGIYMVETDDVETMLGDPLLRRRASLPAPSE